MAQLVEMLAYKRELGRVTWASKVQ